MKRESFQILGVPAHLVDFDAAVSIIRGIIDEGKSRKYIVALNAEKIMMARRSPEIMQIFKDAALIIPDGVGVSLASRILYGQPVPRVQGYDLFLKLVGFCAAEEFSIFLLGGEEEVVEAAGAALKERHSDLSIAGTHHGYFVDDDPVVCHINERRPDVLFVGMGSPKQEQWIHRHIGRLNVRFCFGVGGSFDVIAGKSRLAPAFIRSLGFEFVYRLLLRPKRLRRQLVFPNFLATLLATRTKLVNSRRK